MVQGESEESHWGRNGNFPLRVSSKAVEWNGWGGERAKAKIPILSILFSLFSGHIKEERKLRLSFLFESLWLSPWWGPLEAMPLLWLILVTPKCTNPSSSIRVRKIKSTFTFRISRRCGRCWRLIKGSSQVPHLRAIGPPPSVTFLEWKTLRPRVIPAALLETIFSHLIRLTPWCLISSSLEMNYLHYETSISLKLIPQDASWPTTAPSYKAGTWTWLVEMKSLPRVSK